MTLGLLTVPVVIVATEEAIRVIPRGVRESSYALGATKFQTLRRVILPLASPGILTGFILAMARAAGEVAPLMLTGVATNAATLPMDGNFPYFHLERQFMHLGYQIYSVRVPVAQCRGGAAPGLRDRLAAGPDRAAAQRPGHDLAEPDAEDTSDSNDMIQAPMNDPTPAATNARNIEAAPRPDADTEKAAAADPIVEVKGLSLFYGRTQALQDITIDFPRNQVTALIGPSGCGKSTLLRCLNRMNDLIDDVRTTGSILVDGQEILDRSTDVIELRQKVGMVFQRPTPFAKSIYENVAYGLRISGVRNRRTLDEAVERSLHRAALWDEVKDRLHQSALGLSGGQHQRLCIARAVAVHPEIILMDEPCSALDPRSTTRVEDLIGELRGEYTIIIVTHNMQQAARVSDHTAFLFEGVLIEFRPTQALFTCPAKKETEDYLTGRFG